MKVSTLRTKRNELLKASDFLMLPDVLQSTAEKEAALAYRTILRELVDTNITDEDAKDIELPVANPVIAGKLT